MVASTLVDLVKNMRAFGGIVIVSFPILKSFCKVVLSDCFFGHAAVTVIGNQMWIAKYLLDKIPVIKTKIIHESYKFSW